MKLTIFLILFKLIQVISANGPGILFVQLLLYHNPSGKTDAGKDCDSWFHQFVNDRCDLVFNICVKDADIKNQSSVCDVGSLSTLGHVFVDTQRVMFGNMIGFIPNPFNFSLTSMPENIKIGISINDDDPDGQELISQLEHAIQLPIVTKEDTSTVQKIVLSSRYSEMSFKVFGRCAPNYYGPGCSQYCKPSFSQSSGHYACDKITGEKYCLIGWTGENCRQRDICQIGNPCRGSSRCSMNESLVTCQCPPTFTGRYCEISVRPCDSSPCVNGGLCVRKNISSYLKSPEITCHCPHNYTGAFCQEDVNECHNVPFPCQNDAKCVNTAGSYYCACINHHWGVQCENPPVYSVMGLDGSFMYKNSPSISAQNVIIILLSMVASLIAIILILVLLYIKKHHSSLLINNKHSGSESSVYSQCHYEDIEGKTKDNSKDHPKEEEPYTNIYEQQFDDEVHHEDVYEKDDNLKKEVFVSKCLSETVI